MPATRSTRRRAPRARGRRSGAGSAAGRRRGAARSGRPDRAARCDARPHRAAAGGGAAAGAAEVASAAGARPRPDRGSRGAAARAARPPLRPRVVRRLDQALGRVPEPVSPAPPAAGLRAAPELPRADRAQEDVLAGIDRLLPPLSARLRAAGKGARRVRLTLVRTDGRAERARGGPGAAGRPAGGDPAAARARLDEIDAGFGIEVHAARGAGGRAAGAAPAPRPLGAGERRGRPRARRPDRPARARLGLEAVIRLHPADSHIPEKTATEMAAAFAAPAARLADAGGPRPILVFPPEPLAPGGRGGSARGLRLAPPPAAERGGLRPGADHPGVVARRPGLAVGGARLLAGGDRGGRPALALRGQGRRAAGWFAQGSSRDRGARAACRRSPRNRRAS